MKKKCVCVCMRKSVCVRVLWRRQTDLCFRGNIPTHYLSDLCVSVCVCTVHECVFVCVTCIYVCLCVCGQQSGSTTHEPPSCANIFAVQLPPKFLTEERHVRRTATAFLETLPPASCASRGCCRTYLNVADIWKWKHLVLMRMLTTSSGISNICGIGCYLNMLCICNTHYAFSKVSVCSVYRHDDCKS